MDRNSVLAAAPRCAVAVAASEVAAGAALAAAMACADQQDHHQVQL